MKTIEDTEQATISPETPRLDGDTVIFDTPPSEGEEIPLVYKVTEKPKPPLLNRAQRRAITAYIKRKAAPLRRAARLQQRTACQICSLPFLGVHLAKTLYQCQCKVRKA